MTLPLLRARLPLAAIIPIALAADTLSIAIMEVLDNAFMLLVPWRFAFTVNRAMIRRGKGHAVVHEHHAH